jgi:hypothetical protein
MPRELTAASDIRLLADVAWIPDSEPWIALALARSAPLGRTMPAALTAPRPKLAALMLLMAPVTRALRYAFATPIFAPPIRPAATAPAPYQGWNASNGPRGTQPTFPKPNPTPMPNPGAPHPKKPTRAGRQ